MKNQLTRKVKITTIFTLLLILVLSTSVKAQTTKILFLGNSFTYTYDTPSLFEGLANSGGFNVVVDEFTAPGIAVYDDQVLGHINNTTAQSKITSQQWDYIIVQDNMGGWIYDYIVGGPGNANMTLYNQIKANNPCTRIIYFSAWGQEGGVPQLGYPNESTESCIDRIYQNFIDFNDQATNEIVCPVGKVWNESLSSLPNVDLFYSDNVHPSLEGSYLCAVTLFSTIFKTDPTNLTYNGGVSSSTANTFKSIAWNTVMDPTVFTECNLDEFTPSINSNSTTISSVGFTTYQWYFNGVLISGATSSDYTPTQIGTYSVVGFSASGCASESFNFEVTTITSTASNLELSLNEVSVYPNPAIEFINIKIERSIQQILVYDAFGKKILTLTNINSNNKKINVSDWETGVYLITILDGQNNQYIERLIVK